MNAHDDSKGFFGFPIFRSVAAVGLGLAAMSPACAFAEGQASDTPFKSDFAVDKADLASSGDNDYFILKPGYVLDYKGAEKDNKHTLTITVLDETKMVDGVETRVVEESESEDGAPAEISRNYFAIDQKTKDIYYFGEAATEIKNGKKSVGADSWVSGVNGARFGLAMPAKPQVGMKFYQEQAPNVAMDRVEVASLDAPFKSGAADYPHCVKTLETSAVEPDDKETKFYAKGIGQVMDEDLVLVWHGYKGKKGEAKDGGAGDAKDEAAADPPPGAISKQTARDALAMVGADPAAEKIWFQAINDPSRSTHERQDLIEDLNETGFADPKNLTRADLPMIQARIAIIEAAGPGAMDKTNADAFQEAYKDLLNMRAKLAGQ